MSSSLTIETPNIEQTLLEIESAESAATERAARLWRFLAVTIVVWAYYCIYYSMRGYSEAALICFSEAVIACTFLNRFRRLKKHYKLLMHGCLTLSAIGLFSLSICRGSQLADTIYFIPCTIIIAAHLIGNWAALIWCLVSVGITFVHFKLLSAGALVSADQMVNAVGFSATVFFLCHQAEYLYEKRTNRLLALSNKLRRQSIDIQKLAKTDPLTGLDNRLSLVNLLSTMTRDSVRKQSPMAVMVIDLDGFKEINDTLGHGVGDDVLRMIAGRLKECLPEKAIVARLGGDEFCILIPDVCDSRESQAHANDIVRSLRTPFRAGTDDLIVDASIGICVCPDMAMEPNQLISFADTAMHHAKSSLQRQKLYEPSMTEQIAHRLSMQEKLTQALDKDEFSLVFQPQVNLQTKTVESVEALLRWNHEGQSIPPVEFIPLLENTGDIVIVSRWVVEQCCKQISKWEEKGHDIRISINLSAVEFSSPDFIDSIEECLIRCNVDARNLEFEITESLLIENVDEAIRRLCELKELGSTVSVDDFGTGYSSLAYLKQFPIDRLKIDRAFVKDFPDSDDGLLASSIIVLGQTLGMKVIAEGVETQQQLDFLSEKGCDEYQGYLLSPPIKADECESFFGSASIAVAN